MESTQQHQAKTGAKAGQWVACSAKQKCRNSGMHVDTDDLVRAKTMYEDKTGVKILRLSNVPKNVVEDYLNSTAFVNQKTVAANPSSPLDLTTQKHVARRNEDRKDKQALDSKQTVMGVLSGVDARTVNRMLVDAASPLAQKGPLTFGKTISDEVTLLTRENFSKITTLTPNQRLTLAVAINDLTVAHYDKRWDAIGKREESGVGFKQAVRAVKINTWNSELVALIDSNASNKELTEHFVKLEEYYSERVNEYKKENNIIL